MTELTIFGEGGAQLEAISDPADIASTLSGIGVRFERHAKADHDALVATLRAGGFATIDTVTVTPDHPEREAMRARFLSEHRHAEDEVRLFVEGEGLFTLREAGRIFAVRCVAGDLISVPAGMRHWFDMGPRPSFTAIRFFRTPDGWIGDFTGDPIADRFPRLEAA